MHRWLQTVGKGSRLNKKHTHTQTETILTAIFLTKPALLI